MVIHQMSVHLQCLHDLIQLGCVRDRSVDRVSGLYDVGDILVVYLDGAARNKVSR